jgi:hypothetical protein
VHEIAKANQRAQDVRRVHSIPVNSERFDSQSPDMLARFPNGLCSPPAGVPARRVLHSGRNDRRDRFRARGPSGRAPGSVAGGALIVRQVRNAPVAHEHWSSFVF